MDHEIAPNRELIRSLRLLDHAAHDRHLQILHLATRHIRIVHPRHTPMQVPPQIRLHPLAILQIHLPRIGLRLQRPRQRDGARHDAAGAGAERRGGVGEGREDGVRADEVGLEGPARRVRVEVAEEDVDEEGALEGHLLDAQVGDPFAVVACGKSFRSGGDVGGGGGGGGDTGGDGGGEGGVAWIGGGGGGEGGEGGIVGGGGVVEGSAVGGAGGFGMDAALLGDVLAG